MHEWPALVGVGAYAILALTIIVALLNGEHSLADNGEGVQDV